MYATLKFDKFIEFWDDGTRFWPFRSSSWGHAFIWFCWYCQVKNRSDTSNDNPWYKRSIYYFNGIIFLFWQTSHSSRCNENMEKFKVNDAVTRVTINQYSNPVGFNQQGTLFQLIVAVSQWNYRGHLQFPLTLTSTSLATVTMETRASKTMLKLYVKICYSLKITSDVL